MSNSKPETKTETREPKRERQQLSKVVDLSISPARVRSLMDHHLINQVKEAKDSKTNEHLMRIRKEECPVERPSLPTSPGKKADKVAKEKYQEAKKEYLAELKAYDSYTSPRYAKLEILHAYCRHLEKLISLLLKNHSESVQREIDNIHAILNDEKPLRRESEAEEAYEKRTKKFESKGYLGLRSKTVKLDDPNSIQAEVARLRKANQDLEYFVEKNTTSKERIRFNDQTAVAVAAFMETTIEQLVYHTIDATIHDRRRTMKPDHCVSTGIEDCSLFPLISNLPHYLAIVDRQKRSDKYELDHASAKAKNLRETRRIAKNTDKPVKRKFEYPKFQEVEVKAGFAKAVEGKKQDGSPKINYRWYGIDIERDPSEESEIKFTSYAHKVCKNALDQCDNAYADEIKISGQIAKFFSDLIVDFIKRLAPLAMLNIECRHVKTIDESVITNIVKHILLDSYKHKSAKMSLTDEHDAMFASVKKKVETCYLHQTGVVTKEAVEKAPSDLVDDDEPEDDLDEPEQVEEHKGKKKVETKAEVKVAGSGRRQVRDRENGN